MSVSGRGSTRYHLTLSAKEQTHLKADNGGNRCELLLFTRKAQRRLLRSLTRTYTNRPLSMLKILAYYSLSRPLFIH